MYERRKDEHRGVFTELCIQCTVVVMVMVTVAVTMETGFERLQDISSHAHKHRAK